MSASCSMDSSGGVRQCVLCVQGVHSVYRVTAHVGLLQYGQLRGGETVCIVFTGFVFYVQGDGSCRPPAVRTAPAG